MKLLNTVRASPLIWFVFLACVGGWTSYFVAGIDPSADNNPLGPLFAAFLVLLFLGKPALKEWGSRLITVRTSPVWYSVAFIVPILITAASVLINHLLGAPLPTGLQLSGWTNLGGSLVAMVIFVGVGEEAGWTAFAAPRLLNRHSFVPAWLILSAIRITWHLPMMLNTHLSWTLGVGGNLFFQFVLLWLFIRSGRQWFPAAIWHATLNTAGGMFFFRMVTGDDNERLGTILVASYGLLAGALALFDRKRLFPSVRQINAENNAS
jgi:membrane protease YdiL (CAAX protease family)